MRLYAHRGACQEAPENTLAAFLEARRQGAHGIEMDTKLSADGVVFVMHDPTVDRTTNGSGAVKKLTAIELRRLDAGIKRGAAFAGEVVPTLDAVFETLGDTLYYDVELTNYASPFDPLPIKVADLVKKHHLEKKVIFTSFLPFCLFTMRRFLPEVLTGLIALPGAAGGLTRSWLGRLLAPRLVVPHISSLTESYALVQLGKGRQVIPWTVNDPADVRRVRSIGLPALITDVPEQVLQELEAG